MSNGPAPLKNIINVDRRTNDDPPPMLRGPSTPTRRPSQNDSECTPRPKRQSRRLDPEHTPRAAAASSSLVTRKATLESTSAAAAAVDMSGFTISHLRRVPELALMASKLYKRVRDEQKQAGNAPTEPARKKTKRLFELTVNDLRLKGSIIPWDGTVYPLPDPRADYSDTLWRIGSSSRSTASGNMSSVSTSSAASPAASRLKRRRNDVEELQQLSDPSSDEDSFVPLRVHYLARQVEATVGAIAASLQNAGAGSRLEKQRQANAGMSVERITRALKNIDDRWRAMSEYSIREALQWLEEEGRARRVSMDNGGRWVLCD